MREAFHGSFREACDFELAFRRKNPGLAQRLALPLNLTAVESYVDGYNAARCLAGGWKDFVESDDQPAFDYVPPTQKKTLWDGVAGVVRGGRAALSAYAAMFGNAGPVAHDLAEQRAAVCAGCPQNDTVGGYGAYFVEAAAAEIMALLGALKDMELKTSHDAQLGICKACLCPMKAKVHVPLDAITKRMPPEVWPKLQQENPVCWIRQETVKP